MTQSKLPGKPASKATIAKNQKVRTVLSERGDDGREPRNVCHYLYPEFFPDRKREAILAELSRFGYEVKSVEGEHGLVLRECREVASPDFDDFTEALEELLISKGWQYDGWECEVVHPDHENG